MPASHVRCRLAIHDYSALAGRSRGRQPASARRRKAVSSRKPIRQLLYRPLCRRPQDLLALVPIAWAEFVGLQCIQHAQHLRRIAAN
jgi:hypothetical protein